MRQEICGNVKWDTVVVSATAVGMEKLKAISQNLKVYPVPAQDYLELKMDHGGSLKGFTGLSLYNHLGQIVREEELTFKENTAIIKTENLEAGVYVLQLKGEAGMLNKRFIISR